MRDVGVDPKKLLEDALGLSFEDRAEIAARLLDSLAPPDPRTEAELTAEVVRRAREVAAGTAELVDWEVARKRIEAKLRKS